MQAYDDRTDIAKAERAFHSRDMEGIAAWTLHVIERELGITHLSQFLELALHTLIPQETTVLSVNGYPFSGQYSAMFGGGGVDCIDHDWSYNDFLDTNDVHLDLDDEIAVNFLHEINLLGIHGELFPETIWQISKVYGYLFGPTVVGEVNVTYRDPHGIIGCIPVPFIQESVAYDLYAMNSAAETQARIEAEEERRRNETSDADMADALTAMSLAPPRPPAEREAASLDTAMRMMNL